MLEKLEEYFDTMAENTSIQSLLWYSDSENSANHSMEFYENGHIDDLSHIDYPGPIKTPPLWEILLKITAYMFIIILSLIGNILVIFIVWRNKRMRTTTNFYLVNLAVCNIYY